MFNARFLTSRLGQAATASMAAMALFVVMSSQIAVTAPIANVAVAQPVLLA